MLSDSDCKPNPEPKRWLLTGVTVRATGSVAGARAGDWWRGRRRRWGAGVALVALCLSLTSCDRDVPPAEATDNAPTPPTETATSGEVTLTVTTDRGQARVAEVVRLTLEATAPADVEVELPEVARQLEDFAVRDHGPVEMQTEDQTQVWRQWWDIDSNLSGERAVPALTAKFADGEVTTAPLKIEVISAIEGEFDPTKFADIQGPVAVPKPRSWVAAYVAAAATLLLAALVWWMLRRRSARLAVAAAPPPPHVWALQQLEALLAEKLIEAGRVQEFYFRISDLVRTYIELRFGLMAPERTTEEFLIEVRRSDVLRFGHKDLLGEFLTACDLVKFARHEPQGAEVGASIDAARSFIEQTAPAAPSPMREAAA
ncbi:MAG: hypothetical protein ACYSUQ_08475 [Planctomycetota bacterium]